MKNGRISCWHFSQKEPYNLYIEKNRERNELIIEFTGKILQNDYPSLINQETMRQCLYNINMLDICHLDVDHIMSDATVVKCDITQDVQYDNLQYLTTGISSSIKNHKKYTCRKDGNNITITNNVSTPNRKIRLTIYDKDNEMALLKNKSFYSSINNLNSIREYFSKKIRFELNLNSIYQIKKC